jgi:ABC-type bacteriocin/lantibiotic exporter with double-glycine peptidase domain
LEKKALVNQNIKSNFIKELSSVVNGLYTEIVRVILYIFGVLIIINNGLDTGSIIAFIAFALGVINPIGALMDISHQFDILSVSLEKLCTVYSQKNLRSGIKNIKKDKTICEFDHVTFSYNNKIILNDLSFKVKRGEKIALIGGNGTGKSTIAKLIMGLYDYKYGSIKLNKVEASTLSSRAIRNRIFYFPQSVNYLEGLGKKKEHSLSKIIGTIIQGSSLEKVNNQKVSGGQRKLLALNAEFDDSYDLYIFDELISEIDEKNSELILSKLINDPDKTIIFISHNDKVIERVDRVIQLDSKVLEGVCYESKNRSL